MSPLAINSVFAGAGFGNGVDITGTPIQVPTYFAHSPSGMQPHGPGGVTIDTGFQLRKFVDTLPSIAGLAPTTTAGTGVGNQIPLAVPEKWVDGNGVATNDDYYEIAVVEYTQRMHADLAKATRLRGYVQLETPKNAATSKHVALKYPDGTPILDIKGAQVYAYDNPYYLGPVIIANRGTAVRLKFSNYLPVGVAKGAELFIPVDQTLPGAGFGPDGVTRFTQNRAAVHLHGGDSPWISDGTPHQWITPAGEKGPYSTIDPKTGISSGKGVSTMNVPDMPDPGPGSTTYYFPNDLSGRLMFYHDHSSGITRLNVYAGMAAGYLITDPVEQGLISSGIIPAEQIPLVIQDKTFVPKDVAVQDAKWDTVHWGQEGDLWFPHVYETNQDPNSFDGTNPVGRWDWGPWFWPVFPAQYSLPTGEYGNVSTTPEDYGDTAVINGVAYPTLTVQPKAYRFRILNAANDRYLNLSLFVADPTIPAIDPLTRLPNPGFEKEVKMVPAVPNPAYPTWAADGRAGGAPDPTLAGPDIYNIGSEGGFLPHVSVIKPQPVTYEYNRRSITVLNVLNHGLYMGPAERADAIIDFSQYAGKTLIVYNDAPAPNPAFDPRNDYYTGDPDMTGTGGAHSTKPGYGPNSRTLMQIKVAALPPNTPAPAPYNLAALQTALPRAYGQSQDRPAIPEAAYNDAFGTRDVNNYASIFTGTIQLPTFNWTPTAPGQVITSVILTGGGTGYTAAPQVVFNGGVDLSPAGIAAGNAAATAVAVVDPVTKMIKSIQLTSGGAGYTSAPLITFVGGGGMGATASVKTSLTQSLPIYNKAIQELFEPIYGRMNATLGVEMPFTNNVIQTTIPLNYIDPVTETIADGETQIWKVTHNGVDSHTVHFHKINVQVINRIGWDGSLRPPKNDEMGWKETVVMNPLEDIVVAVKGKRSAVPFGMPQSVRAMDPSQPLGSTLGFTQVDLKGNPTALPGTPGYNPNWGLALPAGAVANAIANFDNEFVWHCHLLSHEENDFMRPFVFTPNDLVPQAPRNLSVAAGGVLSWSDPTPTAAPALDAFGVPTLGNPRNEIGFKILRSTNGGAFVQVGTALANATSWTDPTWTPNGGYVYQVAAFNAAGDSPVAMATPMDGVAPTAVTFPVQAVGTASMTQTVTLSNYGAAPLPVNSITIDGADFMNFTQTNNCGTSVPANSSCAINVAFTPKIAGARTALLTVNDGAGVRTVALSGTGAVATSTLTPTAPVTFASQQVGGTSVPQTFTLTNTGSVAVPITSILTGGTNYLDFVQTNNCGTSLAVGASCAINVSFAPKAVGARVGAISVVDAAGTHTVTLNGTGVSTPSATLAPLSVAFGNYPVAATKSAPQPVVLTNTGNGPLAISKIGIDFWGNYSNFAQTNNCGTSLPGGQSCTINVTFTPNMLGTKTGHLSVTSAAGTQTVTVTGTAANPTISLTPTSLAFGSVMTNVASPAQTVTLKNTGVIPVAVNSIGIDVWGNNTSFSQTNTCGTSLAVGASCTISVTFKPTATGAKSGRLKVVDGVGTQYVNFSGTGL
ncbi:MAG TPA: choice-of-anchor D domain-containing protein [Gallionella sp.]|nr:choice-of-anchor D domain-containing protein [Gallionella sp.]